MNAGVKALCQSSRKGRSDKGLTRTKKVMDTVAIEEAKERLEAIRRGMRMAVLTDRKEVFGQLVGEYCYTLEKWEKLTR